VEAAYYSVPTGWIGRSVNVQWDGRVVRVLDPRPMNWSSEVLLHLNVTQKRGTVATELRFFINSSQKINDRLREFPSRPPVKLDADSNHVPSAGRLGGRGRMQPDAGFSPRRDLNRSGPLFGAPPFRQSQPCTSGFSAR
jgi:hypothetical protein